jgi:DNA-binding CsgD family transcriptional regulator
MRAFPTPKIAAQPPLAGDHLERANEAIPTRLEPDSVACCLLDGLNLEVVVVDGEGTILFYNYTAGRLLAESGTIFRGCRGNLCFADGKAVEWFQSSLRTLSVARTREGPILLLRQNRKHHRIVSVRSLESAAESLRFVVAFSKIATHLPEEGIRQLMRGFGLTRAEQRLAQYLAVGGCLSDAASSFGLSRHTVGNQLRSVFEKTGVKRQADLLRLMWGSGMANAFG